MAEDPQPPPGPGDRKRTRARHSTGGGTIRVPELARSLESFSILQRHVAAQDFRAITSARNAIADAAAMPIPKVIAAQQAIAKQFAQTINFSVLAAAHKSMIDAGALGASLAAQTQWAASLAKSVDFTALNRALGSMAALTALTDTRRAMAETLKIADSFRLDLPTFNIPKWVEALNRWIPVNLRDIADLESVAALALDEGLPLSWVPRAEIVVALVAATGPEQRQVILTERTTDILDDCEASLAVYDNEWATQCRSAIGALRAGFDAPAQSHASNIIDSIVLALHGKSGRDEAKKHAKADFDDLPLQLAAENLTLRPLFRAFIPWWPASSGTPPQHFARHPTSHAVGHVGVFAPLSALVAVMLATSLTIQYSEPAASGARDSR